MEYLIFGFAPGIFWLYYFYKKDKFEPEPKKLVLKVFFWGMLIAFPVVFAEFILSKVIMPLKDISPYLHLAVHFFIIIGPVEEYAKYFVARNTVYELEEFDEPMDGIIYCTAAALGFASIENVAYMLNYGKSIIILRGLTATPMHALLSGIIGYYLGIAKFNPEKAKQLIMKGLVLSFFLHGLYDFLIVSLESLKIIIIPVLLSIIFIFLLKKIKHAQNLSPHKS